MMSSLLWPMSAVDVQSATKNTLGCIKGLGKKRVEALVSYRKTHTLNSLEELLEVKGIGKGILNNIKTDAHKKVCTNFTTEKKPTGRKRKKEISAE